MTIGMLWLYDRKNPLAQEIAKAAAYHLKKYGRAPDLCLINPADAEKTQPLEVKSANGNTITIRPWGNVPPRHLWIGVEEMPTEETK